MTTPDLPSNITCFRCGECCRRYQVLLECTEVERLATYLGLSPNDFLARHADPRWPGTEKCLVQQVGGHCPFLRGEGKEFLCAVHPEKPQPCRDWAANLTKPECQRGLRNLWHLSMDKTGRVQGTPEDVFSFENFLITCTKEQDR